MEAFKTGDALSAQHEDRKLRVLCLHGVRTNSKVMQCQMKGLQAALGDNAEFVFLDGPHPAVGPPYESVQRAHGKDAPFYEWYYEKHDDVEGEPENGNWKWNLGKLEETLAYMEGKLDELGPFDVVVGFSQGSALLSILSMLSTHRNKNWWKLCVCFSGVGVQALDCRELFETPDGRPIRVPFPSIHIVGKKDSMYQDSLLLVRQYDAMPAASTNSPVKRVVLYHDGGHRFPSVARHQELYENVAHLMLEHCFSDSKQAPVKHMRSRL